MAGARDLVPSSSGVRDEGLRSGLGGGDGLESVLSLFVARVVPIAPLSESDMGMVTGRLAGEGLDELW